MAVDSSGNLYVGQNSEDQTIIVFSPKDTGIVTPSRTIAGPLTHMGRAACNGGYGIFGLEVDDPGNIYALYRCFVERNAPTPPLTVYEFGPTANGNVAPIRSITTPPEVGLYYAGSGLAVDSAGSLYASGSYQDFSVDGNGIVEASFSNGQKEMIGQVAVATVSNQQGLQATNNTAFLATLASGPAVIGTAGNAGRGTIEGAALESSNVDVSTEFSALIVAQRAFEANSKSVTTFDQATQEAINMIH